MRMNIVIFFIAPARIARGKKKIDEKNFAA